MIRSIYLRKNVSEYFRRWYKLGEMENLRKTRKEKRIVRCQTNVVSRYLLDAYIIDALFYVILPDYWGFYLCFTLLIFSLCDQLNEF